jgi:hypothetical protein
MHEDEGYPVRASQARLFSGNLIHQMIAAESAGIFRDIRNRDLFQMTASAKPSNVPRAKIERYLFFISPRAIDG